jgi:hypothetical protein
VSKRGETPPAPTLQSIVPLGVVPARLRTAVVLVLRDWGFSWEDVSFAGTAGLHAGEHSQLGPIADELWILAITAAPLAVGDELESAGGRRAGVTLSAFSGGVIPVPPYQAHVYEYLGPRGGGDAPGPPSPSAVPTNPEMEPAARDRQG